MTASAPRAPLAVSDLRISATRRRREAAIRALLFVSGAMAVVISILIILSLAGESLAFLAEADVGTLIASAWQPRQGVFGIPTLVAGTLVISAIAMVVATPLGLGAAIFLAEYASRRTRRIVKPVLEVLASIPSVVLGFFALTVFSPALVDPVCPGPTPLFTMAAAGLAVGVLITPLVATIAEDSMYAVPDSLREASYGLGARKRTTSIRVVVPAAVSGIVAALIVGLSRAIGETMIVAIVAGGVGSAVFNLNPCLPGQTMTAAMTSLASGSDQVASGPAFASLFFVGMLLFVMTLALNLISERFVRRARQRY
jgi:phosphate transport system permease protein